MNYLFLAGLALTIVSGVAHSTETSTTANEKRGNKRIEQVALGVTRNTETSTMFEEKNGDKGIEHLAPGLAHNTETSSMPGKKGSKKRVEHLASGVAHSAETSRMFEEKGGDKRIEHIKYSENKVIRIAAVVNHPFLIEFKGDDPIEEVAGGEIAGWDVQKKSSRLYIRAMDNAEDTTLLVTSRSRSYVFDLVKAKATAKNIARLRSKIVFDYPPPPASLAESSQQPVRRNENYSMQVVSESADIRPRDVFDDGRFTWFKFSENGEIPAIYKSQPNTKDEVLIGSHMEGDYVVMHAVSPLWNLRLGESMIGIFNDSFDAQGVGPEGGTTVRGFVREIKK